MIKIKGGGGGGGGGQAKEKGWRRRGKPRRKTRRRRLWTLQTVVSTHRLHHRPTPSSSLAIDSRAGQIFSPVDATNPAVR